MAKKRAKKKKPAEPEAEPILKLGKLNRNETVHLGQVEAAAKKARAGPGHPINYAPADWIPIACPKCGSSDREPFHGKTRKIPTGLRVHPMFGVSYNFIVFRPTKCRACNQAIMTREYGLETREAGNEDGGSVSSS
jgi:hypothetical protein